ncbi:ribonuclease E inhibitor RraB [Rhizorhabdus dicambivorans]|uniref:Ribonuclease E inhibitor RraB n=1 Tax=Rhizorhabdus dicambivorans TaxID=1850238 RepID=A0A2A4FY70_9SPHN|nr:ribonuclease E inhibitor RraB [Rhizorhabdus dicambivorans]ATE65305.1 ribonuclease E inhibitor RraB [Rhizorhabdus dicambivorans]PCE42368.1 ribonuclease E inhibitor RraB [Rhizorhabdus dicambivorans]
MTLPAIDPARLEEECLADAEVLANLKENGDRPELVRPVDVSFRGTTEALVQLTDRAEEFGFEFIEIEEDEEGEPCLFLTRDQAADAASIKELTTTCLRIEQIFGVEYDGWGCELQDGKTE